MTVWRNQALDYEPSHRWRYRRLLRLQQWHGNRLLKRANLQRSMPKAFKDGARVEKETTEKVEAEKPADEEAEG